MSQDDVNTAEPLRLDREGQVAILTLNRPERGNAINPEMMLALEKAWAEVERDEEVRAVIVTGAGDKHFCTGADVSALQVGMGGLQNTTYASANRFSPRMCHVTKPVLCVVNGLANAGGLHFVADSDIVIACESSEFMDSHVSVGQVSALESVGIARRGGIGAALLMGLSGRDYRMSAARAHALGIIDLLEPTRAQAMTTARDLAQSICLNSPRAMALTKRAIWASTELSDPAAQAYGWELLKSQWAHPDFEEGPRAFDERRAPQWTADFNARR